MSSDENLRIESATARSIPEMMLFRDDRDRLLFVLHLGRAVRRAGLKIHAYCVMGTHYHVVVEGSPDHSPAPSTG